MNNKKSLRNIAIIAHVDHGKTTLVDQMLIQAGMMSDRGEHVDRVMDSDDLEKERGITILAKNTAVDLPEHRINIVDTPGHMDFGGEVERTLQMVEGFILLVDAAEGPLPGTRFVLQKALELGLKPIVLINKIDRKDAVIEATEGDIADLFLELAKTDDDLDYPVLYGAARDGYVNTTPDKRDGDLTPLFDAITSTLPAPVSKSENLQMLVTSLDYSDYVGRLAIGRIVSGTIKLGQQIVCCTKDTTSKAATITKLYRFSGINRVESEEASFGDIIVVAGVGDDIAIGSTICASDAPEPLSYVMIDEPTLSIELGVNDSPLAGQEGKFYTSRQIRERLDREIRTNVALRVEDTDRPEVFKVSGRGQLHLGVLIENMRREGFELQVSAPQVIYKTIDGTRQEPVELLTIDTPDEYQGTIIEKLSKRKAIMQSMTPIADSFLRIEFMIPSRGLIGFRSQFVTDTRGTGKISHRFSGYEPCKGQIDGRTKGALISTEKGTTTGYSLDGLQPRGTLFLAPTAVVYEGMIIGEHTRSNDLDVNPTRPKKLTNVRSSGNDDALKLSPPTVLSLEEGLDWINSDELIEVTPESIRFRKKSLKPNTRKRT
jgi:GTP-binding protein